MCNGEPRLRMGGPHYLSCLCSQPVLFRCSPQIWDIFFIYGHYVLCIKEVRVDPEPAGLQMTCVHWLPPPSYNDVVKVDSCLFLNVCEIYSEFTHFICALVCMSHAWFITVISWWNAAKLQPLHGPCHPYYFSCYPVQKGRWEGERQT